MHDAKGRPLKEGDLVLIPARITLIPSGEDYCNVNLGGESACGRRPAWRPVRAIRADVLLRANDGRRYTSRTRR